MAKGLIDFKSITTASGNSFRQVLARSDGRVLWSVGAIATTVIYVVDTSSVYTEEVDSGASVLSPTTFTPTKTGYTFVGWRKDKTASGTVLTNEVMGTEPITLYAVFKKDVVVQYAVYGESLSSDSKVAYYNNGNIANPTFTKALTTKDGWNPIGWSSGTEASASVEYASLSNTEIGKNVTLYAKYKKTITLTYYQIADSAKKTSTGTSYHNACGNTVYPKFSVTPTGFGTEWSWRGWTTEANNTMGTIVYENISNTEITADTTLYPLIYMVVCLSYNGNGATSGSVGSQWSWRTCTTSSIGNTDLPASFTLAGNGFTRTDYNFSGWDLGAVGDTVTLYADTTAKAQWTEIPSEPFYLTTDIASFTTTVNTNASITGNQWPTPDNHYWMIAIEHDGGGMWSDGTSTTSSFARKHCKKCKVNCFINTNAAYVIINGNTTYLNSGENIIDITGYNDNLVMSLATGSTDEFAQVQISAPYFY